MSSQHANKKIGAGSLFLGAVFGAAVIGGLGYLIATQTNNKPHYHNKGDAQEEQMIERAKPIANPAVPNLASNGPKKIRTGEELVTQVCSGCHGTGMLGSPKIGDNAAWAPRIAQGLDALVNSAKNGKGQMNAQFPGASEFEIRRAIVYMTGKSGGTFKEPEAPKDAADNKDAATNKDAPAAAPADQKAAAVDAKPAATTPANTATNTATTKPSDAAKAPATPSGKALVESTCINCHGTGVANAPKIGDKAAWEPRLKGGIDALVKSAIAGKGAMPPKGTASNATDAELKAAIEYMSGTNK